ncbi:diguanylate cyclase/phosphodiesterase (GGDEF & EAL domains) with PAS/PAC sensor(s) [hydrothermal vent metagenome]|uniref:Diguanylate cyclase/phosphodiesterase (GGDEF & EAL domains) with PAS/PAC sensor(S) n=1 Tax=hydrothermal vent metagenome TaxID=652676 RepID=A0A3B0WAT3_9ZZZZ
MSDKGTTELELEITHLKKINSALNKRVEDLNTSNGNKVSLLKSAQLMEHATDADANTNSLKTTVTDIVHNSDQVAPAQNESTQDDYLTADIQPNIPMNGIMGMLEMLLNSDIDGKSDHLPDYLPDTAFNSENSLLTVINDILDFSKIKSGKLCLHEETFNLANLFNKTADQMADNARSKNLKFITHFPENIEYEAVGDSARLHQVIVNILDNAIKFTKQGEVEFNAEVEIIDKIFHVDVTIRDTGKGIDLAYQTSIFEPFEQEDDVNLIQDFSATGLGLSITRDLIQLMGGEISLQSSPGKGSTFHFDIELGIANKITSNKVKKTQSENKIRILLAEDTLANQEIMFEQMDMLGYKIEVVENGLQALEAINQNVYALIFMDIHMPYMDGFAATEAIRTVEKEKNREPVPIIAVTADLSKNVRQRCDKVGMNSYLSKPFSINDIETILKTWLGGVSHTKTSNKLPILSSPKDLSQAVIEQLRALSKHGDQDTLSNAVSRLNLAYTILFTLQKTRNANALWQQQQLLEAAEYTAQVSHWSWEPDKQHIQFSHHLQRYFSHPLTDIKTLEEFIENIGDHDMDVAVKSCLATGQDSSWEQKSINKKFDDPRYLLHRFRIVSGEDRRPMLIGTVQEISSIRRAEQRIMELAFYDPLTKLSSRSSFNKQLQELIVNSQRRLEKFALLYLDIDDFKNINDSFGHDIGDKLLIEVANRLKNLLRESDFASRLGGDEFCMLINDIKNSHSAENVAKRCLALLAKPFILAGRKITPHASIGIAMYPNDGSDANVLIKMADTAMHEAKKAGKKQCMLYETAMTDAAQHRLTIEEDLRIALNEQQFELYYQPKISLFSGKANSVEALIRWNHPDNKVHAPDSFIPDAERLGLIISLGEWVVKEACTQIKKWKDQGLENIAIAVNISPQHFEETDFARNIAKIVNGSGVSPALIEIEITESTSRNQQVFLDTCQQLRKLGFKTAIDDFGTGYSSLSVLKGASIDVLKIDREFIRHLPNDSQASILIGTILGMSKALGMQVVAEGVETEAQLKVLVAMGCHMAQGYYFSKPVQATEIPALIELCFQRPKTNQVA